MSDDDHASAIQLADNMPRGEGMEGFIAQGPPARVCRVRKWRTMTNITPDMPTFHFHTFPTLCSSPRPAVEAHRRGSSRRLRDGQTGRVYPHHPAAGQVRRGVEHATRDL